MKNFLKRTIKKAGYKLEKLENKELKFTFFYAGYGYPDEPKYYNTVVFHLTAKGNETLVETEQGDFSVFKEGETFITHTRTFWNDAVKILKELAETKN